MPALMSMTEAEKPNLRGRITVQLTSYLIFLDSAGMLMLKEHQFDFFGQIQTSQTGGQTYSDTPPMASVLWKDEIVLK